MSANAPIRLSRPNQIRLSRPNQAALAAHALEGHLRRCRTCREAARRRTGLCERGRVLLYALEAASELLARA